MCLSFFFCKGPASVADDSQQRVSSNHRADDGSSSKGRPTMVRGSRDYQFGKSSQTDRSHQGNLKGQSYQEKEKEKYVDEGPDFVIWDRLVISISSSSNDEEECIILNSSQIHPHDIDFGQKMPSSYFDPSGLRDDDVGVISERGQVACRDYPHSRHHCAKFPFNSTTHERCCPQCYCYVCDLLAPCKYWNGKSGHCHASDREPKWTEMRTVKREILSDN